MEDFLSWLAGPLFPSSFICGWMLIALPVCVLIIVLIVCTRAKNKRRRLPEEDTYKTEAPEAKRIIEAANLQGIGSRQEQQDAFGMSNMDNYDKDGLLAVLCDGMGGMAEGGRIAAGAASELVKLFPWEDDRAVKDWIDSYTKRIYQQFFGHGGTTLVAAFIKENKLKFWCVGDSDLLLLRDGKLYALNIRQEYKNDLVLRALEGTVSLEAAFADPQAGALYEYIGKEELASEETRIPFVLEKGDVLLLCSDGISDTLTLKQIREMMSLPPHECCEQMEKAVLKRKKPNQDNYTAIVLKYNGR